MIVYGAYCLHTTAPTTEEASRQCQRGIHHCQEVPHTCFPPVAPCQHANQTAARVGKRLAWECTDCGDLEITSTTLGR